MTGRSAHSATPPAVRYLLRLYVAGMTPRSTAAILAMKALCREELSGCHDLEVIDIYQQPQLAEQDHVVALPTVIKTSPPPSRRSVGDLTDRSRVMSDLNLARAV